MGRIWLIVYGSNEKVVMEAVERGLKLPFQVFDLLENQSATIWIRIEAVQPHCNLAGYVQITGAVVDVHNVVLIEEVHLTYHWHNRNGVALEPNSLVSVEALVTTTNGKVNHVASPV